jgi:hypothetical protein
MHCELCGASAPTKNVTLLQNIGLLVVGLRSTASGSFCRRCIDREFWTRTLVTFFFGWWGIISFFLTPIFLVMNVVTYLGALSLPVGAEGPGLPAAGADPGGFGGAQPGAPAPHGFEGGAPAVASAYVPAVPAAHRGGGGGRGLMIFGGIVGVLVLGCCGTGIAMVALGSWVGAQTAAVEVACDGLPVSVAAPYAGASSAVLALERDDRGWSRAYSYVPGSFTEADTSETTAAVLCLEPEERISVEVCDYTSGATVTRYRYQRRARVIAARSGTVLAEDIVIGGEPQQCGEYVSGSGAMFYEGSHADGSHWESWSRLLTAALARPAP